MDWTPLLEHRDAERAWDTVEAIATALRQPCFPVGGLPEPAHRTAAATLPGGAAGLAVLFAYLSRVRSGHGDEDTAERFIRDAAAAVSGAPMGPALHGGFTGIAWTLAHLRAWFLEDEGEATAAIDAALCRRVERRPWRDGYDLIGGLVGIGVYATERLPQPAAVTCLASVVERLAELAERTPNGRVIWRTRPEWLLPGEREAFPDGCYALGMAHGVPGVVALLGQAYAAGIAAETAAALLEGAVPWLLEQQGPDGSAPYGYSTWQGTHLVPPRLAWCYGDPGVAAGLLVAARGVGRPDWEAAATAIARRAAACPEVDSGVADAGFCHGAAGVAHLFNRMFQATGDPVLRDAACRWFGRTLAMRQEGQGVAGFSAWARGENGEMGWQPAPGLLMGAAGIALPLLSAVCPVEPAWDRVFLVSVPAPRTASTR